MSLIFSNLVVSKIIKYNDQKHVQLTRKVRQNT